MHIVPIEIPLPKNEADFESMCAQIYGVVFADPLPKINGRKGQKQDGIDVFVNARDIGRIGIQCKKYFRTKLKQEHIEEEIKKADKNKVPIKRLLIATTSPSDAILLQEILLLSDERGAKGLFCVEVEFWEDIENRINSFTVLQDSYAPQSTGAAYYRQDQKLDRILKYGLNLHDKIADTEMLPVGRAESANKIISSQLDHINELLKTYRYQLALEHADAIGTDLEYL